MRMSIIIAVLCFLAVPGFANDSTLIQFEIEDQHKKDHTDQEFRDKVSIFIAGDKIGSDFIEPWYNELVDSLTKQVKEGRLIIQKMANVKGVPFFVKGAVRKRYKEDNDIVLMDWKGKFLKAYEMQEDVANILIFSSDGNLEFQIGVTEINNDDTGKICEIIRKLIK